MSGDVKRTTREDVAHLRAGMEVTALFDAPAAGEFEVKGVTHASGFNPGILCIGGHVLRYVDGEPGSFVVKVVSTKPPKPPKPVHPVGTRVRQRWPFENTAIATEFTGDRWYVFSGPHMGEQIPDDEVEGWEVIRDVPEVPDDVIEAAAKVGFEAAFPHSSWPSDVSDGEQAVWRAGLRAIADKGYFVGSVPENVVPDGHVTIDLVQLDTLTLRVMLDVLGDVDTELKRRGGSL